MLNLSLTENGLHYNLENLLTDLETFSLSLIESLLLKQLAVSNEHLTKFTDLTIEVIWCDLIQLQTHLLSIILLLLHKFHILDGHRFHFILDLLDLLSFSGVLRPLPVVIVIMLLMHSSLEAITTMATTTTTSTTFAIVIVVATAATATTTLVIASVVLVSLGATLVC